MRVIVCGGRHYDDEDAIRDEMERLHYWYGTEEVVTIVHGASRFWDRASRRWIGADYLASKVAVEFGMGVEPHRADWERYGRPAGPIRNREMASLGAELVLAWPGGSGTADMVNAAREYGIPVWDPIADEWIVEPDFGGAA